MKISIFRALTLIVFVSLVHLMSLVPNVLSNSGSNLSRDIYVHMLGGGIYKLSNQTSTLDLVVDFEPAWDNPRRIGWWDNVFSNDGQYIAYARSDVAELLVGASSLEVWDPIEFPIVVGDEWESIEFSWLPDDRNVVVSFWAPDPTVLPIKDVALVKRYLLNADEPSLNEFPYTTTAFGLDEQGKLVLEWSLEDTVISNNEFSPYLLYSFQDGSFQTSASPIQQPNLIWDISRRNWDWTNEQGLAFLNRIEPRGNQLGEGLFWWQPDYDVPIMVQNGVNFFDIIAWSPDGTPNLLVQEEALLWHIFNVEAEAITHTINLYEVLAVFDANVGIIWFQNHENYIYVLTDNGTSQLHIQSLSGEELYSYSFDEIVFKVAVSQ